MVDKQMTCSTGRGILVLVVRTTYVHTKRHGDLLNSAKLEILGRCSEEGAILFNARNPTRSLIKVG